MFQALLNCATLSGWFLTPPAPLSPVYSLLPLEHGLLQWDSVRPGVLPHPLAEVLVVCSIRVVSLEVLDYLEPLLSAVAAVQAVEWVLFGVGEVVVAQPSSPAEGPLTDTADIGAFLTVLLHVGLQQEACLEALSTLLTDEGASLPMACFLVDPQSICTVCAVFTLLTAVRLSTCRDRNMNVFQLQNYTHTHTPLLTPYDINCSLIPKQKTMTENPIPS